MALYAAIPVGLAGYIKLHTGTSLKNSMTDFKGMSFGIATKLAKTMPVTAACAYAYGKYKQNMTE